MDRDILLVDGGMIDSSFEFWFSSQGHLRSPFPVEIRDELKEKVKEKFLIWLERLTDKSKNEINDEIILEKFEEILFEVAMTMVQNEDDQITIKYPFLPRINDEIFGTKDGDKNQKSIVVNRKIIKKEDQSFLKIKLRSLSLKEEWETEFELPE